MIKTPTLSVEGRAEAPFSKDRLANTVKFANRQTAVVMASDVRILLAALEEAEGRLDEHALFDAETDLAFKDLDATIANLTARAEKAEQQSSYMRAALNSLRAILTVPAAEYVPAISDAWAVIDDALQTEV